MKKYPFPWLEEPFKKPNDAIKKLAQEHQNRLTKPQGSLGRLEEISIHLASLQNTLYPKAQEVFITIFAADHGVAQENVSAYPQAVTAEMLKNFAQGGAAISVLAKALSANLQVFNLGTVTELPPIVGVHSCILGPGTHNMTQAPALSSEQLEQALEIGAKQVDYAIEQGADIWIGGEMGIGNTTSATALACALLNLPPADLVGSGTGLSTTQIEHKRKIIESALARHQSAAIDLFSQLRHWGGFEIAALVGGYIRSAQRGLPVLVDGFITSVAALVAVTYHPEVAPWLLYSHQSAEKGHQLVLKALNAKPLLNLNMRLGEASGAATAIPLLRLACTLHQNMATFESAGVSNNT